MKKTKKVMSTFEREMQDPQFAKAYKNEYQELVLSELLLALMDEDDKSVRQLAKEAGISANAIQNIRSGKSQDMRLKNFIGVVQACGYNIVLEKEGHRIPFTSS
jgi:DNA-binding Xre family transcriptional regulator